MDKLNQKAFEILEGQIEDLEQKIRDLEYENEDLERQLKTYNIERLQEKERLLSKLKVALNSFRNFFTAFDEVYEKVEAGEYIKGSDPVKDIIDEILKEREEKEKIPKLMLKRRRMKMELPNKKYKTIVIDPPWNVEMSGNFGARPNKPKKLVYNTLSIDEIKNFPIGDIAEVGCHVYLWTTNKMLPLAFDILKAWGVNYHIPIILKKKTGMLICNGYRSMSEICLLGFYGKPMQKWIGIAQANCFEVFKKSGKHSHKPDEFYEGVRKMSPEPRIDIFARRSIVGFDAWGDEAPKESQSSIYNAKANSTREQMKEEINKDYAKGHEKGTGGEDGK